MNKDLAPKKTIIAFFDFDGTLAKGDSLWPFLIAAAGPVCCTYACLRALVSWLSCSRKNDKRSVFKEKLLYHTLNGRHLSDVSKAAQRMSSWPRWIDQSVAALKSHHAKGHRIVIASGSLDLYLDVLLAELPHDAVLCTKMEINENKLTGYILSGNCVRERKAQFVSEYLATNGPFEDSYAYGNAPHDLPMMDWVKNKVII